MRAVQSVRTVAALTATSIALVAAQAALGGAAVDPKPPLKRLNTADNARAKSAVTRLSDLVAGFSVDRTRGRAPAIPHCDGYPGDRSGVTVTGSATSSFVHNSNSIASTVLYFKTFADADRYWKATVRPKYVHCLARFVSSLMLDTATTTTLMAKQVKIGPTSAQQATAFRTISRVEAEGVKPYAWTETVAFVRLGRAVGILRVVYVNHLCECHTGLAIDLTRRLRKAG